MIARRDFIRLAGGLALLPGCAALAPAPTSRDAAAYFDARSGRQLGWHGFLDRLASAPILLLGEIHDNEVHHRIRAAALLDWVRRQPSRSAAVVFEQLDREYDAALRLAQRQPPIGASAAGVRPAADEAQRNAELERLLTVGHFDQQGWGWPAHRPVFEAALASGATWIAGNYSRASARRLMSPQSTGSTGADGPDDPQVAGHPAGREAADLKADLTLQAIVDSARWSEAAQASLELALMEGHCNALPARALPAMVRAQRLRDAALALPLLDANERRTVLIAGNGHVRRDHAVPRYLGAFEFEALVVGFEEREPSVDPGSTGNPGNPGNDQVMAARAEALADLYDLVCFTASAGPREDPCAGFSRAVPTQTPSR